METSKFPKITRYPPLPSIGPRKFLKIRSPTYNAREKLVRESVLAHGKVLVGPSSWQNRPGYQMFQGRKSATNTGYEAR